LAVRGTSPNLTGKRKHGRSRQRLLDLDRLSPGEFHRGPGGIDRALFHRGETRPSGCSPNPSATAVWPPTGIALAAILILGNRVWPAILVGAFFVNYTTAGPLVTSLGIAVGNTLEAVLGAYLVRRFAGGRLTLMRAENLFRFIVYAALFSTAVCATCGVLTLTLSGLAQWNEFGAIWLTWWLGDMVGDLVVARSSSPGACGAGRERPRERPSKGSPFSGFSSWPP
jgi:hypothetical protein